MAEDNLAYSDFESLWEQANNPELDTEASEVEGTDNNVSVHSLLQQFSNLANNLESSGAITSDERDDMLISIAKMEETLQTVDPQVLADALSASTLTS